MLISLTHELFLMHSIMACSCKSNKERYEMDEGQKPHSSGARRNLFSHMRGVFLGQYREFVAAVQFLSILPVPGSAQLIDKDEVTPRIVVGFEYFPLVGLLLALLLWLLVLIFALLVPHLVLAALLVAVLKIL